MLLMTSNVLTLVSANYGLLGCDATQYGKWVQTCQWYCLHLQGTSALKMDAVCSSETLEPSYQTHSITSQKITIPVTSHSDSDDKF
jgi:hypothetical protein